MSATSIQGMWVDIENVYLQPIWRESKKTNPRIKNKKQSRVLSVYHFVYVHTDHTDTARPNRHGRQTDRQTG